MNAIANKININKLEFIDGDFNKSKDWCDLILEGEGSFDSEDFIIFDSNGIEVSVNYTLSLKGDVKYVRGDEIDPSYFEVNDMDSEIEVTDILVNDVKTELTKDMKSVFLKEIKKIINND